MKTQRKFPYLSSTTIRKKNLSLLEVVVAFTLTAILLTTLFSCYRHLILSKNQIDQARQKLYPKVFTQARLLHIFDNLEEGQPFYTNEGVLKCKFFHGLDREPKFCGAVEAELYLKDKQLILRLNEDREEVLQVDVQGLSFKFYDLEKGKWFNEWRGTTLPTQVRVTVSKDSMTFNIPNREHKVSYP